MVACISPALQNLAETVKTLRYAQSAKKIKNKPVINLDPREEMLYMLKREIQSLKRENELLKSSIFSDPRYQELLDFISQGKHLVDLPEISRGPQGKTNILYKGSTKEINLSEDNNTSGFDKSFNSSGGFEKSSRASASNQSSLEKYRKNRTFTPGLAETKEVSNTWRSGRSISRNNTRGRQSRRSTSSRDRSASASTRASVASRASATSRSSIASRADSVDRRTLSSAVSRTESIHRPSAAPKKSIMKRELSGRFDYNMVPDLNLKLRKNAEISKVSKGHKEQTIISNSEDDSSHDEKSGQTTRKKSNKSPDVHDADNHIKNKEKSRDSKDDDEILKKMGKDHHKKHKAIEIEQGDSELVTEKSKKEKSKDDDKRSQSTKKVKEQDKSVKTDQVNTTIEPKKKKSKAPDEPQEETEPPKKDTIKDEDKKRKDGKKKSLVRKESELIGTESDNHSNLPDIVKLKKKTMKDVIALDEEIKRMS